MSELILLSGLLSGDTPWINVAARLTASCPAQEQGISALAAEWLPPMMAGAAVTADPAAGRLHRAKRYFSYGFL